MDIGMVSVLLTNIDEQKHILN